MRFLDRLRRSFRALVFTFGDALDAATQSLLIRLRWRSPPSLGDAGERAAASFLGRRGYRIVGRGVDLRVGELDIVAVDDRIVVYVEVKTRRSAMGERPGEAVNREKRRRICRAANAFARQYQLRECASRFDVVEVIWPLDARRPAIRHWPAAFESELP